MIKRKQNKKTINDQKKTEHKDYQWSKGNRTQRLSMIKRKLNKKTINDQKETEKKTINDRHITIEDTKAWITLTLLKTGMKTGLWHRRMDTFCSTSHTHCVTEQKDYQ
jgi:hypothetical protein